MTCNNCNCQCNDEKYYQEWVAMEIYPIGTFFNIKNEVFKVVEDTGCELCEFNCDSYDIMCRDSICSDIRGDNRFVVFILYDTLDENEYEA